MMMMVMMMMMMMLIVLLMRKKMMMLMMMMMMMMMTMARMVMRMRMRRRMMQTQASMTQIETGDDDTLRGDGRAHDSQHSYSLSPPMLVTVVLITNSGGVHDGDVDCCSSL